jgi:hypothetical protein
MYGDFSSSSQKRHTSQHEGGKLHQHLADSLFGGNSHPTPPQSHEEVQMDLRYPIGKHEIFRNAVLTPQERKIAIDQIAQSPAHLKTAISGLNSQQLDTPYRPEGWTVRQVVHHLPDSHINAYVRFKLALAENEPTIKPYDQALWAKLQDSCDTPVEVSLALLAALHERWTTLLRGMHAEDFERRVNHPEIGVVTLDGFLSTYAWHGQHHVAHITSLRDRMGWS